MRVLVAIVMLCAVQIINAQIQIIPHEKLLEAAEPKLAESALRFVADKVDFGTIDEMSGVWQSSANLVNSGADTIIVTRLKTTCGCLKADIAKRVLAPKEQTNVILKYYPRGHAGRVMQRLFVYTNSSESNPSAMLRLQGVVTASVDRSDDYPYTRGALRLRQDKLEIDGSQQQRIRIACMNGGTVALRPSADTMLSSKALKVCFEPALLAPNQEGDMIVEYSPKADVKGLNVLKIFINGLGVSPRHSVVEIKIKE